MPLYNYPTTKPACKYPTTKPINVKRQAPTVKPFYKYPSKMPVNNPPKKPVCIYLTKMPQYPTASGNSLVTIQNLGNVSVTSVNTADGILALKKRL